MGIVSSKSLGRSGSKTALGQSKGKSITKERPKAEVATALITYHESRQKETIILSMPSKEEASDSAAAHSSQKNRRAGSFYSKTTSEVGDWVCIEGVLSLTWTLSGRTLDFIQKTIASEIEWKCEGNETDLRFTRSGGSIYLPAWIIPKDPEDLRLELIKKSREKEIKQQQEEGNARGAIAATFNECAICFFELYRYPIAILRYQSKRSCPHYLHSMCANAYRSRLERRNERLVCPVCFKRFTEVKTLPDLLRDPRLWFQLCDTDLTGSLDKQEVMEGLLAVLAVNRQRLENAINGAWDQWDKSGDGSIELAEFIDPKSGLKAFLVKNYHVFRRTDREKRMLSEIPSLDSEPRLWFEYWDNNQSGTLERIELARALIKTFCVTAWGDPVIHRAHDMGELALSVWDILGYRPRERVSFEEFMKPFGLADQVLHNYIHGQFFGDAN